MKVKLTVVQGKPEGKEFILPNNPFLIGRGKECHLRPNSETICERHCAVIAKENAVHVRDLTGSGGTRINGQAIEGEVSVKTGDLLQVGPLVFALSLISDAGKKTVASATKTSAPAQDNKPGPTAATSAAISQDDGVEDADVADWLSDGETPAAAPLRVEKASRELPKIGDAFDDPFALPQPSEAAEPPSVESTDAEQKESEPKPSKIQHAATSRAASDILRKYFTRPTE